VFATEHEQHRDHQNKRNRHFCDKGVSVAVPARKYMADGKMEGMLMMGQNPAVTAANSRFQRVTFEIEMANLRRVDQKLRTHGWPAKFASGTTGAGRSVRQSGW
jgi:hypothetical protein